MTRHKNGSASVRPGHSAMAAQHPPRDEAWLIGEHRMSGEKKYYLANLPAKTDLRTLATTIQRVGFASRLTSK